MDPLFINGTSLTPEVNFNVGAGVFSIVGKSIPEDAEEFYAPVMEWVETFVKNTDNEMELTIALDFFNISSSKRILFLMYKLNELVEAGGKVNIRWMYRENDDDMFEVGQDYAFMVNIPFEFLAHQPSTIFA